MSEVIRDGNGTGYLAAVNTDNELRTRATAVAAWTHSSLDEQYFEASTGQITITDAAENPFIYILNSGTEDIIIDRVFYDIWASTNGVTTDGGILRYYRNPPITGGTPVIPACSDFGATVTMSVTCLRTLTTMTGTAWWTAFIKPMTSNLVDEGRIILPSGSSFGISITAPASNTSMKVSINVAMYNFDRTLLGL